MGRYAMRRLLIAIPTLTVVSMLIFGGIRVIPGDVCRLVLQTPDVDEEQCEAVEEGLGLNKPAFSQYLDWSGIAWFGGGPTGVLQGDFGKSIISKRDVFGEIRRRMYLTVELTVLAATWAVIVALPIGVYSAIKQDKWQDYLLRVMTIGWQAMPNFWVATMLVTFPAKWWGYSPPVGYQHIWQDPLKNLEQLYLPAFSIGLSFSASLSRLTRSTMLEVLRQDYVRTARSKGLRERAVLSRHALKNAMLPVITLFGLQLGFLLSGTVILESIYALPGLGTLLLSSVLLKDYTQIQGLVLFFACIIIMITLIVDLTYAWIDPRVKYS